MVLRFNRAVVRKHEADVGKFWTHWCCTFRERSYPGVKGYPIQEFICCDKANELDVSHLQAFKTSNIICMPGGLLRELYKKYTGSIKPSFYKPSTGLKLLWWVYKETGTKISKERLFGFDCFCEPGKSLRKSEAEVKCRKYYTSAKPSPKHRPVVERAIYNEITT